MGAKDLKNQAAAAKRTATAVSKTAEWAERLRKYPHDPKTAPVSERDIETLRKASAILEGVGRTVGREATRAAATEESNERAKAKARAEAEKILATWLAPATVLDQVVLAAGGHWAGLTGGMRELAEDLKDLDTGDHWKHSHRAALNDRVEDARRSLVERVAYHSLDGRPVAELMATARTKLEEMYQRPEVKAMAERWQARLYAEQEKRQAGNGA